jgi:hypothetical protein
MTARCILACLPFRCNIALSISVITNGIDMMKMCDKLGNHGIKSSVNKASLVTTSGCMSCDSKHKITSAARDHTCLPGVDVCCSLCNLQHLEAAAHGLELRLLEESHKFLGDWVGVGGGGEDGEARLVGAEAGALDLQQEGPFGSSRAIEQGPVVAVAASE